VGEENGDGGCKGRTVGGKDICEQCLGELKHWLNGTLPRSPGMREKPVQEEDEEEQSNSEQKEETNESEEENNSTEEDPFSAKPSE
jgi:hypothetical protein